MSAGGGPRFPVGVDEELPAEDLFRTARTATGDKIDRGRVRSFVIPVFPIRCLSDASTDPWHLAGAGRLTALDCEDTKVLNMASATKTRQTSGKKLPQIGEVAEQVGLSPRTVRDGGGVGMFSPPTRRSGGSRLYSEGGD